jgi:hypothetical protein
MNQNRFIGADGPAGFREYQMVAGKSFLNGQYSVPSTQYCFEP